MRLEREEESRLCWYSTEGFVPFVLTVVRNYRSNHPARSYFLWSSISLVV